MSNEANKETRKVLVDKTDNRIAYKAEGKRRMKLRKEKRNDKYRGLASKAQELGVPISAIKHNAPWKCSSSPTGYRQICSYKGTCQFPCNGDC